MRDFWDSFDTPTNESRFQDLLKRALPASGPTRR
jgi:hypothetical protein